MGTKGWRPSGSRPAAGGLRWHRAGLSPVGPAARAAAGLASSGVEAAGRLGQARPVPGRERAVRPVGGAARAASVLAAALAQCQKVRGLVGLPRRCQAAAFVHGDHPPLASGPPKRRSSPSQHACMRPESNEMSRRYQGAALPGPGGGGGGQGTPRSRPGAVSPACCQLSSKTGNGKRMPRERDCHWLAHFLPHPPQRGRSVRPCVLLPPRCHRHQSTHKGHLANT